MNSIVVNRLSAQRGQALVREAGRRHICAFYLPGETFGVETIAEHNFSAEAVTEVDIVAVNSDTVVASQLLMLMGRELERAQHHVLLLAKSAPERVASFLLKPFAIDLLMGAIARIG
jgi:CRP-like cAMP-binding protein